MFVYKNTIRKNEATGGEHSFCPGCDSEYTTSTGFRIGVDGDGVAHRYEELLCLDCRLEYSIPGAW